MQARAAFPPTRVVVELGHLVEAEFLVVIGADPFGGVDRAFFERRIDIATGDLLRHHAELGQHLTGKTTDANPGVLGLLRNYVNGALATDAGGLNYTIIGFGNGENRPTTRTALTDATVFGATYHQEAVIKTTAGSETHGGGDVFLGAIGKGAEKFTGVLVNTEVFGLIRGVFGL
jgi:alkaline phosphatase